tara:strand:- start:177 stop:410 length:234 start_codon:yes stop_codon:yes gene_type:complete
MANYYSKDQIDSVINLKTHEVEALRKEIKSLEEKLKKSDMMLMWYNDFVDLIQDQHNNIYNSACEYADEKEYRILNF